MPRQTSSQTALDHFLLRAESLLARLEPLLPPLPTPIDWQKTQACRWKKVQEFGFLEPVSLLSAISLSDLQHIDEQKKAIVANTRQFLAKKPANHVLLTGTRGSGKSSLIKALLNDFQHKGLRVIEVEKNDLIDLPHIVAQILSVPKRFVIFCDDLSFDAGESHYKALKVVLDGSLAAPPENVLIYATSNRRHLLPEYFSENLATEHTGEEVHPNEAIEEQISLSERFGLWLSFYPFDQDAYLAIVAHWLANLGGNAKDIEEARREALNFALQRGSRSGRIAFQFAKDWMGKKAGKATKKGAGK